ncbi:hypothetical protein H0H93_014549 [Arthromyces matolae]|nr:hypothetical protein H0H93_014549 [Arthromyces matolae]
MPPRPRPPSPPAPSTPRHNRDSVTESPGLSPASSARQKVQQNLLRTTSTRKKRVRKEPQPKVSTDSDKPDASVFYGSYGRKYARVGDIFNRIETIAELGIKYEVSGALAVADCDGDRHLLESWKILKDIIPGFSDDMVMLRKDKVTRNLVFAKINSGCNDVRSEDTNSLKVAGLSYLLKYKSDSIHPNIDKTNKSLRGWTHPQCAAALCPMELPATQETFANIEAGNIAVTADQFPRFLYPDGHVYDQSDVYSGLFRGHFCFRVAKHIFQGPSSAHEVPGWTRGKNGNAALAGVTSMSPRSIAYVAVQARFCISSGSQWGSWDKNFDYAKFYWNIVDIFEGGEGKDIISAFNYEVFGVSNPLSPTATPMSGPAQPSQFELLREQRAAKRARMATQLAALELEWNMQKEPSTTRSEGDPDVRSDSSSLCTLD